ncbi:unnamed protein product [Rhizophagus irregularis]|nr:unnamed protein product [Rhizophagus irregularis]
MLTQLNLPRLELSVHSNLYYWILKTYRPDSRNTQRCCEDIIESRIWVDLKLQESRARTSYIHHVLLILMSIICGKTSAIMKFVTMLTNLLCKVLF